MGLYINGNPLAKGVQHFLDSIQIKQIYYRHGRNSAFTLYYQYDSVAPTLELTSPSAGTVISANKRTFTITGTVSDTESGIASVTINDVAQTLEGDSFTFTTGNDTQDYVIKVTDNAGNVLTKTIKIVRENYNSVYKWRSNQDTTYWEYCRCNVCGEGGSANKWIANGQNVYDHPNTLFSTCPNYPHHKYTITIS